MLKCAQKMNFTPLLKLILKKHYSIRYVDIGTNILYKFGLKVNSPLRLILKYEKKIHFGLVLER